MIKRNVFSRFYRNYLKSSTCNMSTSFVEYSTKGSWIEYEYSEFQVLFLLSPNIHFLSYFFNRSTLIKLVKYTCLMKLFTDSVLATRKIYLRTRNPHVTCRQVLFVLGHRISLINACEAPTNEHSVGLHVQYVISR